MPQPSNQGVVIPPAEDTTFILEKVAIEDESDQEIQYDEVPVEDIGSDEEEDESLTRTLRAMKESTKLDTKPISAKQVSSYRPEVVEDYIRNFLSRHGMKKTMNCFQTEWFMMQQKGQVPAESDTVDDAYTRNSQLQDQIDRLKAELAIQKKTAVEAKAAKEKLKKEKDYHCMHHRRIAQEKNVLLSEVKRLEDYIASVEPSITKLKSKYETVVRMNTLKTIEKNRAVDEVNELRSTIKQAAPAAEENPGTEAEADDGKRGKAFENRPPPKNLSLSTTQPVKDTEMPSDREFAATATLRKPKESENSITKANSAQIRLINTVKAHDDSVGCVASHPTGDIVASTADDATFRLWSIPAGELLFDCTGHKSWISTCDFHPLGGHLATGSGDGTVKIWDFNTSKCSATFAEHSHAVWSTSFHYSGDFLASASMDNTVKLWDLKAEKCRQTLRAHTDSVNAVHFQGMSNMMATAGADKTVKLWDARTGIPYLSLGEHTNAVNDVKYNFIGDKIASVDSNGRACIWEVRTGALLLSIQTGNTAANKVAFNADGDIFAVACDDKTIKIFDSVSGLKQTELVGHTDAVQSVVFSAYNDFIISSSSDQTVRFWSK